MKIKSVKNLTFHRNGVAGECFYSALVTVSDAKGLFLLTFNENNFENAVIASCRAINISEPETNWRGDEFGYALNDWLAKQYRDDKATSIYDLTTNEERNKSYKAKTAAGVNQ